MRKGFVVSSYTNISQVLGKPRLPSHPTVFRSPTLKYPCPPQTGLPVHHAASPQCRPVRAMCLPAPRMRETQNSLTWISISGFTISTTLCLLTLYKVLQGVGIRQKAWIKIWDQGLKSNWSGRVFGECCWVGPWHPSGLMIEVQTQEKYGWHLTGVQCWNELL